MVSNSWISQFLQLETPGCGSRILTFYILHVSTQVCPLVSTCHLIAFTLKSNLQYVEGSRADIGVYVQMVYYLGVNLQTMPGKSSWRYKMSTKD